jgi:hypothetical protein
MPRAKLRRIGGLYGSADATDNADVLVATDGEVPRRSRRRGKTITLEGFLEAPTLREWAELSAQMREAFHDVLTEGRFDVVWHPLNTAFDDAGSRYFDARPLGLEIADPIEAQSVYRGSFVVAARNHDGRYFDSVFSLSALLTLVNTDTTYSW